ncbi:MAG: 3-methyl-2-oxobutanoate hydroxymethyltransferase [Deltaproteobacteria bacterium]|nr:MAG: 3-methyl-2-oxobutanoate hydroxymethyltransferase [Deltaproteobacteria bacterium]
MPAKKIDIVTLHKMKGEGKPITMVTAYDTPTARLLDAAGVDTVLVGDSVGNVVLGYPDTLPVTMEQMLHHTRAVRRGLERALLIGDMPFMSYQADRAEAVRNAGRFLKEAGADAIKLEGGGPMVERVEAIVQAGIPVVGHLGLTPQSATLLGGYRVQGTDAASARRILDDALALQAAGAFLLVLECVPARLGELLSSRLDIPVIGIGAGSGCDGQVLVFHDLVGIEAGFKPKFVKRYTQAGAAMKLAVEQYCQEVRARAFPAPEHTFSIPEEEFQQLVKALPRE